MRVRPLPWYEDAERVGVRQNVSVAAHDLLNLVSRASGLSHGHALVSMYLQIQDKL